METKNETVSELISMLRVEENYSSLPLRIMEKSDSRYLRDLKVNIGNVLTSENITQRETSLLALAVAVNNKNERLAGVFSGLAGEYGAGAEEIAEAVACAGLLASNNILYRFRHFVKKQAYQDMPAKIRMNIMAKPVLGKEFFELLSLAVSAVNGCEMCVNAHERSLMELGTTEARIWDAIRLASVITSLDKSIY